MGISRCAWLGLTLLLLAYVLGPMPSILSLISPRPSPADFAAVSQRGLRTHCPLLWDFLAFIVWHMLFSVLHPCLEHSLGHLFFSLHRTQV